MATLVADKEVIATSETFTAASLKGTTKIGTNGATTDSIAFFAKSPPVGQASGASQAAITTLTGSKTTTNTAAKLNLLIKYCMKSRTDMIAYGLIKGS